MIKKNVLGKGIGALLGGSEVESTSNDVNQVSVPPSVPSAPEIESEVDLRFDELMSKAIPEKIKIENTPLMVDLSQIVPNPKQPRKHFNELELLELSESIRENGVLQPIIVSQLESGFELIAGERRLRATKLAGLNQIPVIVRRATERDKLALGLLENIQRSNLSCVEEGQAIYQLIHDFSMTQEDVAKRLGKDRSTVANLLRVISLPQKIQEYLQKGFLTLGHAKVLASVKDSSRLIELADEVILKQMSVRQLEDWIKSIESSKGEKNPGITLESSKGSVDLKAFSKRLEERTGFKFQLKQNHLGKGEIKIPFLSKEEFNQIFDYLMK